MDDKSSSAQTPDPAAHPTHDVPPEETLDPRNEPAFHDTPLAAPGLLQPDSPVQPGLDDTGLVDEQYIQANAVDARVRRAPRLSAFFTVGAVLGVVLGFIAGFSLSKPEATNRWVSIVITTVAITTVFVLSSGWLATVLDARSVKRAQNDK
ncbi:hypothetical protein [Jonesia quinghaiensis]|uniref:hypothetical protein n=1 Tax=Jonesia quinghaiensis TaxID=262806 RepID=UPI000405499C|nr:hypothetical protein [Jonesia quinghaiensis]